MNTAMIILTVSVSLAVAGCATNQTSADREMRGGATADNQKEKSLGGPISRINMQIGAPECDVR